jgi:PAS domain S-box-containing protein
MSSEKEMQEQSNHSAIPSLDAPDSDSFRAALNQAKSSLTSENLSVSEVHIARAGEMAQNSVERSSVCCLQIELHLRRSEVPESITVALACLSEFGITIPERPDQLELEAQAITVWALLDEIHVENIIDLPLMANPEIEAVMSVFSAMSNSAYLTDERLLGVTLCHMVSLTLQHGITESAVPTFGLFGFFISHHFGRYKDGLKFCNTATNLVSRHGFWNLEAKAVTYLELVATWCRPLPDVIELTRACVASRERSNDIPYLCYAHVRIVAHRLARGDDLNEIADELQNSMEFVQKSDFVANILPLTSQKRFIDTMQNGPGVGDIFDDGEFNASGFEAQFVPEQTPMYICCHWILKAQAYYAYGDFTNAKCALEKAARLTWACTGHIQVADFHLVSTLTLTALYDDDTKADRVEIVGHLEWLARWADTSPDTFYSKHLLGLAEIARIDGRLKSAERLYEQSIDAAARFGNLTDEAIACEAAGRFYRRQGANRSGVSFLRRARDCFARWGAKGKVDQLEATYPEIAGFSEVDLQRPIVREDGSGRLASVLEISQSLTATLEFGHLAETLLHIATEVSDAERADLIEVDGDDIVIRGSARRKGDGFTLHTTLSVIPVDEASRDVVMEVARTLEPAVADETGGNDMSLPQIAYIPLVKKSRLIGLLRLWSRSNDHRFEEEALAVLKLSGPQAAIALDNARSFGELEREKAALAESEREFRMTNDTMPSMIWSADANGQDEWFNKEWYEYTGLTPREACNGGWKYVFHPDDRAESAATWHRIITKREMSGLEARLRRHDGEYRWFIVRAKPLCDSTGRIVRCYGSESDIDDLKRAEILLAGEKRSFEMIATGQPLATILDSLCQTLAVLSDASFVSIMLLDEDGANLRPGGGHKIPDGFNETVGEIPLGPQSGSCGTAAFLQEPVLVDDVETDPLWSGIRDLAERFKIKACWSTPVVSARGTVFGTIAIYSDRHRTMGDRERQAVDRFTQLASFAMERKKSEEALTKSEALLAEGQRISHTGSWAWSVASDKLDWSEEHGNIFGYKVADVGGRFSDVLDRMLPEEREFLETSMRAAVAQRRDLQFEYQATLPDGVVKQLLSTGRAVKADNGEVIEFIGTTMDITERKRVEAELQKSAAHLREVQAELEHVARATTMGELAASIAHEVNQPLTGIVTSAGAALRWLSKPVPDVVKAGNSLKNVIDDGRRASEIVTRIRKMFRKEMTTVETIAMPEIVADVMVLTRGELQKNRVALNLEIPEKLPTVPGDRVQLQQVFVNLILNAIDAMRDNTDRDRVMSIQVGHDTKKVVVQVIDNGVGVPTHMAEQIFRPFETSKPDGMGMGLSICRTIVENHGGQMRVVPGSSVGSRFEFALPIEGE